MYFDFLICAVLTGAEIKLELRKMREKRLIPPSSLFTECHKVNQIQQLSSNTNHWGVVGHISTQDISGHNEYPQCPLLETEKCTFKLQLGFKE